LIRFTHPPRPARARASAVSLALALGCLGFSLAAVPSARTGTLDAAHVKETVYPNGLRLLVKEARATDLAAVQVWIRAGGFLEDEKTAGTAHVIEHLLFKGGSDQNSPGAGSLDGEIENLGGLLEATTQKDWTHLTCTISGRFADRVLNHIATALRTPRFQAADLAAEKPVIQEEINQIPTNPETSLTRALYQLAFKNHPYRHDVRGTAAFLNSLDLADVRAYYQKHYIPANMTVVVVGDVDAAEVERTVRTAFQADRPGARPAPAKLPPDETACAEAARHVVASRFSGGYVGFAYPAPSVKDDPDVYAMDVLLTMLESGGTGRLPRLLREVGAAQATFETRRQAGLFTIIAGAGAGGADIERVEALIRRELELISTQPIPAAELAFARRSLRGSYALDNETYAGQAGSLGYYASIDRWQFSSEYLAKIDAVTAEQVQAVARKYISPSHCITVVLKPQSNVPPTRPKSGT